MVYSIRTKWSEGATIDKDFGDYSTKDLAYRVGFLGPWHQISRVLLKERRWWLT